MYRKLCLNNCGFYGNETDCGMCSKCFSRISKTIVDTWFGISNGLFGLKRDIIIRLCHVMEMQTEMDNKNRDLNIRTLMGICQEFYAWRKHAYFVNNRINFTYVPVYYRPNERDGSTFPSRGRLRLFGAGDKHRTVFTDMEVTEGVFQWTIKIIHESYSRLFLGTAPSIHLSQFDLSTWYLGCGFGSCALCVSGTPIIWKVFGVKDSQEKVVDNGSNTDTGTYPDNYFPNKSLLSIVVDTIGAKVFFFANKKRLPHAVSGVHPPLYLGVTGSKGPSFRSVSFRRLSSSTNTAVSSSSSPAYRLFPLKI